MQGFEELRRFIGFQGLPKNSGSFRGCQGFQLSSKDDYRGLKELKAFIGVSIRFDRFQGVSRGYSRNEGGF